MTSWVAVRALLRVEALAIYRSWMVRAWVVFALLTSVLPVLIASGEEDLVSDVIGGWLTIYFIPSAIVAAIFGAGSITQDLEVAADSVLTRAVTRYDYVVAKLLSRVMTVACVHVAATLPMVFLARRFGLDDATTGGLVMSSLATGSMLIFLTVLGVFVGTVVGSLAIAVVAIMIAFSGEGLIFSLLEISYLSPNRVLDDLPEIIRGDRRILEPLRVLLAFLAASVAAALAAGLAFERREL